MSTLEEFDCEFDAVDDLALLQTLDRVENKISTAGPSTVVHRPSKENRMLTDLNSKIKRIEALLEREFGDWSKKEENLWGSDEREARRHLREDRHAADTVTGEVVSSFSVCWQ